VGNPTRERKTMTEKETHAWRVRLRITTKKELELITPALFHMQDITETWPQMEIYFSMSNYAIFMVACSRLPKAVDITKFDVQIVDMKKEPERVHSRYMQPRPINGLRFSEKTNGNG
jgi:hypothetical protein